MPSTSDTTELNATYLRDVSDEEIETIVAQLSKATRLPDGESIKNLDLLTKAMKAGYFSERIIARIVADPSFDSERSLLNVVQSTALLVMLKNLGFNLRFGNDAMFRESVRLGARPSLNFLLDIGADPLAGEGEALRSALEAGEGSEVLFRDILGRVSDVEKLRAVFETQLYGAMVLHNAWFALFPLQQAGLDLTEYQDDIVPLILQTDHVNTFSWLFGSVAPGELYVVDAARRKAAHPQGLFLYDTLRLRRSAANTSAKSIAEVPVVAAALTLVDIIRETDEDEMEYEERAAAATVVEPVAQVESREDEGDVIVTCPAEAELMEAVVAVMHTPVRKPKHNKRSHDEATLGSAPPPALVAAVGMSPNYLESKN